MKKNIYLIFLILVNNIYSQEIKINIQSEIVSIDKVISSKVSNDDKLKAIVRLLHLYSESNLNDESNDHIESIFIKSTNLSSTLFFHNFEVQLEEELKQLNLNEIKKVRLFLILAGKNTDSFDYRYYKFSKKKIDCSRTNFFGINRIDCSTENILVKTDLNSLIKLKQYKSLNSYYLNLLYSCESHIELKRIKQMYLFIK